MLQWTLGCISFWVTISVYSDKYPEVELLNSMGVHVLIFWRIFILFSIMAAPIYIPVNSTGLGGGSLFSTSSLTFVIFCCFDNCHSDRYEVVSLWFTCAFPYWSVMLSIFAHMLGIWLSSLEKCLFRSCDHSLIRFFQFSVLSYTSSLHITYFRY